MKNASKTKPNQRIIEKKVQESAKKTQTQKLNQYNFDR